MQVVFDTILSGDFSTAQIGVCLCIESSGIAIDVFAFYSPFMVFFGLPMLLPSWLRKG
jgi:hypothetical protein